MAFGLVLPVDLLQPLLRFLPLVLSPGLLRSQALLPFLGQGIALAVQGAITLFGHMRLG